MPNLKWKLEELEELNGVKNRRGKENKSRMRKAREQGRVPGGECGEK